MKLFRRSRTSVQAGGWDHLVVELAVRVVQQLQEGDRKAVHLTARVWRDAVRLATNRLAPKTLDTGLLKAAFPRVTELVLQGTPLTPHDMLCLGHLHGLSALHLLRCSVQHSASLLALAGLAGLQSLELRLVEGATGEVLDDLLAKLAALTSLKLEVWLPRSRGPKLRHLSSLTALRQLCYKQTPVQTAVPGLEHLSTLSSLEELSLEGASLTNALMAGLAQLRGLTRLSAPLAHALSDYGLEPLRELAGMRALDLSLPMAMFDDGLITDEGISGLAAMQQLTSLRLAGRAGVTAGGLAWLGACAELEHLDLGLCQLGTGNADFLWGLTRLTTLSLRGTRMEAAQFGGLPGLECLRDLDVGNTGFSDACCQHLAPLTALTRLELSSCPITNEGLALLACRASREVPSARLRRLGIDGCRCSVLVVAAALGAHKGVALWQPSRDHMPRFVNVAHALFVAQPAPSQFMLRARFAPEARVRQTLLAWLFVGAFFTVYALCLLGLMVWVVLLPMLGFATAILLLTTTVAGATMAPARCQRLAQKVEGLLVSILVGLHGNSPAPVAQA